MKGVICFLMVCLYALGAIGGICYTVYCCAYVITAGIVGLAWMAWPKLVEYYKEGMK